MSTTAERIRLHRGPALFGMGFRPFFLFAAAWAALAVPLWLIAFLTGAGAERFTLAWHAHEMLFGYLPAVMAGFLLTAIPNWTGRLPVTGWPLAALFALWLVGRLAMLAADELGPAAAIADTAFLFVLAAAAWREIIAGRNLRNVFVCALVTAMAAANVLTQLKADPALAQLGVRIALGVGAMLIGLIGGRITPSFTRNWMAKQRLSPEPASPGRYDAGALALTGAALLAWIVAPNAAWSGAALMLAGALTLMRLARWRGWTAAREPLVLVLHAGYLWLAAGLALMGAGAAAPQMVPPTAGLHALTAGAIGVMTLAVMTRASLGHTGRPLTADAATSAIYLLVNLGALLRTAAPFFADAYAPLLTASALLWCGAFALFTAAYAPLLLRPRGA